MMYNDIGNIYRQMYAYKMILIGYFNFFPKHTCLVQTSCSILGASRFLKIVEHIKDKFM